MPRLRSHHSPLFRLWYDLTYAQLILVWLWSDGVFNLRVNRYSRLSSVLLYCHLESVCRLMHLYEECPKWKQQTIRDCNLLMFAAEFLRFVCNSTTNKSHISNTFSKGLYLAHSWRLSPIIRDLRLYIYSGRCFMLHYDSWMPIYQLKLMFLREECPYLEAVRYLPRTCNLGGRVRYFTLAKLTSNYKFNVVTQVQDS